MPLNQLMLRSMKIHEFNVTDNMAQHCSQALAKYDLHLVDLKSANA